MLNHIIFTGATIWAGSFTEGGDPSSPAPSAALTGTALSGTEAQWAAGGLILDVDLSGAAEWHADLGASGAVTDAFIAGLDSAQSEAAGYNAVFRDLGLTYEHVTRVSDKKARITFPAGIFAITANETLTFTIPSSAMLYVTGALVATPTITIANTAESVTLSGTCIGKTEADWVTGGLTTILTVAGDLLVAAGATFEAQRQNILDGFASVPAGATGFIAEVVANEPVASVVRTDANTVTITWTAAAGMDIDVSEVVTHTMPASALVASSSPIVASPTFTVNLNNLVLSYGFEDWTGDANTTPGYIFRIGDAGLWADQLAGSGCLSNCGGRTAHSGTYFWRLRMDENYDACLDSTPTTENAYIRFGNGDATYPIDSGSTVDLRTAITSEVMSVRFRFRLTGNWPPVGVESNPQVKFVNPMFGNADYDGDAYGVRIYFLANATRFKIWDQGNLDWSYGEVYDPGLAIDTWHSLCVVCTRLNATLTNPNYNVKVYLNDWDMSGSGILWDGTDYDRDIYAPSAGSTAFRMISLFVNYGGDAKPTNEHAIEYDTFEVWDGLPS